jgi:uridine phosphorylase
VQEIVAKRICARLSPGITVTCRVFYGPQGRILRMGLTNPQLIDRLTSFRLGQHSISNFEMETSAIYAWGSIRPQLSILSAIVANRITKEFSKDGNAAVENLIQKDFRDYRPAHTIMNIQFDKYHGSGNEFYYS